MSGAAEGGAAEGGRPDAERFRLCFGSLAAIGRRPDTGGYHRLTGTPAESEARAWFHGQAAALGAPSEEDRNGNLWAWFGPREAGSVVLTGSHLDTVPEGGAYDGALGVVAGFLAVEGLIGRLRSPVAVVAFVEEEGAATGVATAGSRLLAGALDPAVLPAGFPFPDAGAEPGRLAGARCFVELHIEQGRALAQLDVAVAVGLAIWPHGRYRLRFEGEANHAGTTALADRRDPMVDLARAVAAARAAAQRHGGLATVARVRVEPNATNVIPSLVECWLDARAPSEAALARIVAEVGPATCESSSPEVRFDGPLRERITAALAGAGIDSVELATGAGHDAGALAAYLPTAMLFVRNPTGVSHSPAEHATEADCLAGVAALRAVLEDLACR